MAEEIFHTIRYSDGSWQPWGNVSATVANNPGPFYFSVCATIGNDLHVIASGVNYNLYHTIRFLRTYSWQPWRSVTAAVAHNPVSRRGVP